MGGGTLLNSQNKKHAAALGIRIGSLFLMTIIVIVFAAYFILSNNFHKLLTNYSVIMVQSMLEQGVKIVENELDNGQKDAQDLAASIIIPESNDETPEFPSNLLKQDFLRVVYLSPTQTASSDGTKRNIRAREDIVSAFNGESSIYGPYFNEENDYLICYTAPVIRGGNTVGVISIEKDGYHFCELIKNIRFMTTGESYIINAEGTDIAVSDMNHIDWVTTQYNSQKLFEENGDSVTKAILELELKGLRGETGYGTYEWNDGLVHVAYIPISSVGWVLLGGLREEEITYMTQSALFTSISNSPALLICFLLILIMTGLIIYWIISSTKKNAEINERLKIIAEHDPLTGLLNRRFLETSLSELWKYPLKFSSQAAVFMMDIDDFKKYNDFYGHQKGDDCLRSVASIYKNAFHSYNGNVMRYGGEEFIAVIFTINQQSALELGQCVCRLIADEKIPDSQNGVVTVSVGVCHVNSTAEASLYDCIKIADKALYQAKKEGKNRAVLLTAPQSQNDLEAVPDISTS